MNPFIPYLAQMTESELKVSLVIYDGILKEQKLFTNNSLRLLTGLSKPSVIKGIQAAVDRGILVKNFYHEWELDEEVKIFYLDNKTGLEHKRANRLACLEEQEPTKELEEPVISIGKEFFQNVEPEAIEVQPPAEPEQPEQKPYDYYLGLLKIQPGINKGQTLRDAKSFKADGHTIEDVVGCGSWILSNPFWQSNAVPLNTAQIVKRIDLWKKNGRPAKHGKRLDSSPVWSVAKRSNATSVQGVNSQNKAREERAREKKLEQLTAIYGKERAMRMC